MTTSETAGPLAPTVLAANQPADRFYSGGPRIAALRGDGAGGDHVPEDWVASTTTLAGSDVLGLTVLPDGRRLRDAVSADPAGWLGTDHAEKYGGDPALLVKLLDAGERLPVHVHPDDDFAREHLGCAAGKTESWIVVQADPGARVHLGFTRDVDSAELASWVGEQDREALLAACHSVAVRAGDTIYVPAGLPHAIGAGILLVELQQASDLSVLLEYEGFAIDGARDGHLGLGFDTALRCVQVHALPDSQLAGLIGRWDDDHIFPASADTFFRAQRLSGDVDVLLDPGFSVLVGVAGSGELTWGEHTGGVLRLVQGSTVVVPFGAGPVRLRGQLELLHCQPPATHGG